MAPQAKIIATFGGFTYEGCKRPEAATCPKGTRGTKRPKAAASPLAIGMKKSAAFF